MRLLLSLFLVIFFTCANAATYYVSSSLGDDGRTLLTASNLASPWRSIAKVNAVMDSLKPGDQVLFKRGEVFAGMLSVNVSGTSGNPVIFGAYGNGDLPELTGFVQLSGWKAAGNGIWEAAVAGSPAMVNTVTVNGVAKAVGRWPNVSAAGQGYSYYESYKGNNTITDSKLKKNYTGGEVVIRKTRWVLDMGEISSQTGKKLNYVSHSGYNVAKSYGYFVQNHPGTLDQIGEWYYRAGKLGIYTAGGGSPQGNGKIRVGTCATIIKINGQHDLCFKNLLLSGATDGTVEVSSSQSIRISNCQLLFSGKNALNADQTNSLTIENTTVAYTNNNALSLNNCTGTILKGNHIRRTGMIAGMGGSGDGTYEAITISGDNNEVIGNTIDSTGYVALNFSGNNITIKNNLITNFALVKDDGGGIYTWNNGANAPANLGRVITGNIILGGKGAGGGTDNPRQLFAHGIYLDDGAGQVEVSGNTVANCASNGIYVHNAHDVVIKQNTVYNNATQLFMEHDNIAPNSPIYNCIVSGNILFAKQSTQLAAQYKTKDNDIANFGTFENNYYARPIDDDLTIGVQQQVNGVYSYTNLSLEGWQALYGKDRGSGKSPMAIPAYNVTQVTGTNQFGNGSFDSNVGGLYAYTSSNNVLASWTKGKLDGGALKVSFSSATRSSNRASVIIGIGAVTAGKAYRLKFSLFGSGSYKAISAYLRQSTGSYADLSVRKSSAITGSRQEKECVFIAMANERNASVVFDVPEQTSPLFLDNIKLEAVTAVAINPNQHISFFANGSFTDKSYPTSGMAKDIYNHVYQNNLLLKPFASAIIVKNIDADCKILLVKPVIVIGQ